MSEAVKMKTVQGICKFCSNYVMVQVPITVDETSSKDNVEIINPLADIQCTCKEGREWRQQRIQIETACSMIETWTGNVGEPTAGSILKNSVEPLIKNVLEKISVQTDKGVYTMTAKNGRINLTHREVIINEIVE